MTRILSPFCRRLITFIEVKQKGERLSRKEGFCGNVWLHYELLFRDTVLAEAITLKVQQRHLWQLSPGISWHTHKAPAEILLWQMRKQFVSHH